MASTFKFLFRPPYIRPDVVKLGNNGDLLACGGIDGRLNIFSLVRGIHLTTMVFPAPISALTWESITLVYIWKLWIGMRDGGVDSLSISVEKGAQGVQNPTPTRVLNVAGGEPIIQITSKSTTVMAMQPRQNADGGGPIMMTNFGAPNRRISQAIQIANRVILTARGQENRRKEIGRRSISVRVGHKKGGMNSGIEDQGAEDAVGRQRNVDTNMENCSGKEGYKDHKLLSPVSTSVSSAELVSEAGCTEYGMSDLVFLFGNRLRFYLGSGDLD
ncbi:hypothetical protein B0H13DRAFT_1853503 [Mycena leptocephala]|nr:hypothetical protein B0H13DRAFT_1853503 [Mycena leptocephala]